MTSTTADRRFGVNSGAAIKVPCLVATTSNVTLSGEQTIDGVTTSASRVLVWKQNDATQNGIYQTDSASWTRTPDFDGTYDALTGTMVKITSGTANGGYIAELTTTGTIVIGTTALTFVMRMGVLGAISAFIQSLLGAADAPTARTALGAAASGSNADIVSFSGGPLAGLRNRIINGGNLIQQRGAVALSASGQYGQADRHLVYAGGGTSISGNIGTNFGSVAGISTGWMAGAVSASWTTGNFTFMHRIEAANVQDLNGKTITVSCKAWQNTGGARNMKIAIYKPNASDNWSGATLLQTSAAISVPSSAPTAMSATFALGASDAANGLGVLIYDSDAANTIVSKFYLIGDLQLEVGAVATAFEQRSVALELALCQRYFEMSYDQGVAPGTVSASGQFEYYTTGLTSQANTTISTVQHKVTKRAAPTVTLYSPATGTSGKLRDIANNADVTGTAGNLSMAGFTWQGTMNASGPTISLKGQWTSSAEL